MSDSDGMAGALEFAGVSLGEGDLEVLQVVAKVFEPAMHDTALKRRGMKADLQRALEHEEFQLYYQPVIELESGRISGVEALIRWIHPVRGMVAPLDFIPLADERFDLLLPAKYAASREVQGLLKVLTSPWLLAQLASLPGYDATRCGERPA